MFCSSLRLKYFIKNIPKTMTHLRRNFSALKKDKEHKFYWSTKRQIGQVFGVSKKLVRYQQRQSKKKIKKITFIKI